MCVDQHSQGLNLENVTKYLQFQYNSICYNENQGYRQEYSNKIIYFIIEIVKVNPNITINQLCSLNRTTLNIPEEITRTLLNSLIKLEVKVLKVYDLAKNVRHLNLANYQTLEEQLIEQYPHLKEYIAPKYNKKKKDE